MSDIKTLTATRLISEEVFCEHYIMENEQESERSVNIINHADVERFLASNPSPEELEELDKNELELLASYYQPPFGEQQKVFA